MTVDSIPTTAAALDDAALDQLFRTARSPGAWRPEPVGDATLRRLYDLVRLGPTANNSCPARFVFIRTPEGKERLRPALSRGNVDKSMSAPVVIIVAMDTRFYEDMPTLNPGRPELRDRFAANPDLEPIIFRSATLQGAYLILAARALGLDAGPMSGFDAAKLDAAFFPDGRWRSNFLVALGRGDPARLSPRKPRLAFDQACRLA